MESHCVIKTKRKYSLTLIPRIRGTFGPISRMHMGYLLEPIARSQEETPWISPASGNLFSEYSFD